MGVKLENIRDRKYEFDYIQPNGSRLTYRWERARDGRRSIQEVEDYVFEYMKYNTVTLSNRKLVVVDENKKDEVNQLMDEETLAKPAYGIADVKKVLNGSIKFIKETLVDADADTIAYFVRIAKEIKLDSAGKQALLAELSKTPVDILFAEE